MDSSKQQGFSNCSALNEEQSRLALTLLKQEFETKFHLLLSDEVFLEIFKQSFEENKSKLFHMIGTIRGVTRPDSTTASLKKCGYFYFIPFPHFGSSYNKLRTIRKYFDYPDKIMHARYRRLVIHTPHAGKMLPFDLLNYDSVMTNGRNGEHVIVQKSKLLIDHYTDELFAADSEQVQSFYGVITNTYSLQQSQRIAHISFPICRVLCDVERLEQDPLEAKGLGITYDLTKILGDNSHSVDKELAMYYYQLHQAELKGAIEQTYLFPLDTRTRTKPFSKDCHITYRYPYYEESKNMPLLLDCHSFSERSNLLCPNAPLYKNIDICIGYNEDHTQPDDNTLFFVANFFRQKGYNVEFNSPYSNSKTVDTDKPYHSLMIEVNKHCYMNEDTLERTEGFAKLHTELNELYNMLLNE